VDSALAIAVTLLPEYFSGTCWMGGGREVSARVRCPGIDGDDGRALRFNLMEPSSIRTLPPRSAWVGRRTAVGFGGPFGRRREWRAADLFDLRAPGDRGLIALAVHHRGEAALENYE